MKKKSLLLLLGLALCLSSCMKEDDFAALNGNLDITGDFHPTFGLPIATASVNLADLLGMVQPIQGYVQFDPNTEHHLLYISYDTIIDTALYFDNGNKGNQQSHPGAKETTIYEYHQMLRGEAKIDIFDNIPSADQISIDGVYANLELFVKAYSESSIIENLIEQYHVNPYVKNVQIKIIGHDGQPHNINFDNISTIQGSQLVEGTWLHVLDTDFSDLINCRPRAIRYQLDFYVPVTASAAAQFASIGDLIRDSVQIEHLDVKANFSTHFPLKFRANDLPFNVDLNVDLTKMNDVLENIRKYLTMGDSSFLFLNFNNSLPVELVVTDQLLDANGNVIIDEATGLPAHLGRTGTAIIPAADIIQQEAGAQEWISNGSKQYVLQAPIGHKQLTYLEKVKKIRLNAAVSTTNAGTAGAPHVSLRAEDKLSINAYIRSEANLHFDYNILGSDNNK